MVETVPVTWDYALPNEGLKTASSSVFLPLAPKSKITEGMKLSGNSARRTSGQRLHKFKVSFPVTVSGSTGSACNDLDFLSLKVENGAKFLQADLATEALIHLMKTADFNKGLLTIAAYRRWCIMSCHTKVLSIWNPLEFPAHKQCAQCTSPHPAPHLSVHTVPKETAYSSHKHWERCSHLLPETGVSQILDKWI